MTFWNERSPRQSSILATASGKARRSPAATDVNSHGPDWRTPRARHTRHARRLWLAQLGMMMMAGPATVVANSAPGARTLLVVGDSLSAEYGLARGEGWVALLEARLAATPAGKGWRVANASISGETTAGGLSRLPQLLERHAPALTLIELGGNDALRGLAMTATENNLRRMVSLSRAAGSAVLLVGMQVPPNFGAAFGRQFSAVFRRVADSEQVPLVPFLLEGFGEDLAWFQPDRIHPLAKAQPRMLDNVWPALSPLL